MVYAQLNNANEKRLGLEISNILLKNNGPVVFVCVGSDRVVGDCLSPIVGEKIKNLNSKIIVYGSLSSPINYQNLPDVLKMIKQTHSASTVIVIDSVLGKSDEVGFVKFNKGGLVLGGEYHKGVYFGNYHIVGVVNTTGINSLTFLKSVKLLNIIKMSNFISNAIENAVKFCIV